MQKLYSQPLALWVFLLPIVLVKAEAWLKHNGFPDGFNGSKDTEALLNMQQIFALQHAMGSEHDKRGYAKEAVTLIWQFHGLVVHVPADHVHMVLEMQPCIKMAWKLWESDKLTNYILSWKYITSQITVANSADSTNTMDVVRSMLMKYVNKVSLQRLVA